MNFTDFQDAFWIVFAAPVSVILALTIAGGVLSGLAVALGEIYSRMTD